MFPFPRYQPDDEPPSETSFKPVSCLVATILTGVWAFSGGILVSMIVLFPLMGFGLHGDGAKGATGWVTSTVYWVLLAVFWWATYQFAAKLLRT
jgi:hypothetical protein